MKEGTIRFVGRISEIKPGFWVGVEVGAGEGKNDGRYVVRLCSFHVCTGNRGFIFCVLMLVLPAAYRRCADRQRQRYSIL